jgi:dihydropteroate synthase
MQPQSVYLRPLGFVPTSLTATDEDAPAHILPLAGTGLAFTTLEVVEREGRRISRRLMALAEFCERDWGRRTMPAAQQLEALRAPRPPWARLSLDRPRIMGIVNVTPDSFSDGGRFGTVDTAVAHALRLLEEGADILDIGGESTRPGADPVPLDEELRRVLPVLEALRTRTDAPISIDTRKADVMRRAAAAGADILNDVSALTHDPDALAAATETGLPVVLMHAQGDPKTMNVDPRYEEVVLDIFDFLAERIAACEAAGISRARIVVDPGIGFGKHLHHNVKVLSALSLYHALGVPVLLGASRKKLIGQIGKAEQPKERVPGSIAAALAGIAQGVQIVRVHDVAATRQAIAMWQAALFASEHGQA